MTEKDTLKEFEDMFDLSSANDSEDQAEEYGNSAETEEPFEELIKDVKQDLEDAPEKGSAIEVEDPHDIVKDVSSKEPEEDDIQVIQETHEEDDIKVIQDIQEEEKVVSTIIGEMDFDTLPEQEISKKEVMEEINEVHDQMAHIPNKETEETFEKTDKGEDLETIPLDADGGVSGFINYVRPEDLPAISESLESSSLDNFSVDIGSMIDGDKTKWGLESNSIMYEPFYKQKKRMLEICLVGGQIEYSGWTKELEEAQVDVVTEVFDQQVIIHQMEDVQKFRNRVKYIGVRVNNQYFLFKRFTPLLRGYLARIQYLKPVLKQDGLVLEHMGDIEMYFERLEGLHKSVADTENNLAAAYEMLSRKVTICMELPPVERYDKARAKSTQSKFEYIEKHDVKPDVVEPCKLEGFDDFDDLPTGAKAGPKDMTVGKIGWNDF